MNLRDQADQIVKSIPVPDKGISFQEILDILGKVGPYLYRFRRMGDTERRVRGEREDLPADEYLVKVCLPDEEGAYLPSLEIPFRLSERIEGLGYKGCFFVDLGKHPHFITMRPEDCRVYISNSLDLGTCKWKLVASDYFRTSKLIGAYSGGRTVAADLYGSCTWNLRLSPDEFYEVIKANNAVVGPHPNGLEYYLEHGEFYKDTSYTGEVNWEGSPDNIPFHLNLDAFKKGDVLEVWCRYITTQNDDVVKNEWRWDGTRQTRGAEIRVRLNGGGVLQLQKQSKKAGYGPVIHTVVDTTKDTYLAEVVDDFPDYADTLVGKTRKSLVDIMTMLYRPFDSSLEELHEIANLTSTNFFDNFKVNKVQGFNILSDVIGALAPKDVPGILSFASPSSSYPVAFFSTAYGTACLGQVSNAIWTTEKSFRTKQGFLMVVDMANPDIYHFPLIGKSVNVKDLKVVGQSGGYDHVEVDLRQWSDTPEKFLTTPQAVMDGYLNTALGLFGDSENIRKRFTKYSASTLKSDQAKALTRYVLTGEFDSSSVKPISTKSKGIHRYDHLASLTTDAHKATVSQLLKDKGIETYQVVFDPIHGVLVEYADGVANEHPFPTVEQFAKAKTLPFIAKTLLFGTELNPFALSVRVLSCFPDNYTNEYMIHVYRDIFVTPVAVTLTKDTIKVELPIFAEDTSFLISAHRGAFIPVVHHAVKEVISRELTRGTDVQFGDILRSEYPPSVAVQVVAN